MKKMFIVGAGASQEVNLPTGEELKNNISDLLDIELSDFGSEARGDSCISRSLRIMASKKPQNRHYLDNLVKSANKISGAMPQVKSIDNFLDIHSDNSEIELCGKLAIVRSILKAERNSLLFFDDSNSYNKIDFKKLSKTWYSSFIASLIENCTKEMLEDRLKSITFIIFNYDRCIEHFLYHSIQNCYDISAAETAEIISKINIYHPYGVVGNLPWQGGRFVKFGGDVNSQQLLDLAGDIKTFTEGTDPSSSEIDLIRKGVSDAGNIIFLGFAFHELNLKLIKPNHDTYSFKGEITYYGTAKGISDSDSKIVKNELMNLVNKDRKHINLGNDLTCEGLFREYGRSISFR